MKQEDKEKFEKALDDMTKTGVIFAPKSHKEQTLVIINSLPLDGNYQEITGLPIPLMDRLLIKPIKQGEVKLPVGILLPKSSSQKNQMFGLVYAMGSEVTIPVRLGLKIEYEEFAATPESEINHKGETYLIISQHALRAIIPPSAYKYPVYETNDEKRRQMRMDEQSIANKIGEAKLDKLNNE